jgi:chemotaxis protein methyltransferase CheR
MRPPVVLSDQDFARLRLLLSRAAGLVFDASRRESLAYSVTERLRATGIATVTEYLDLVQQPGSPERQQLLDEVTIQETHFFRNPPQVRALRTHVVPELVRAAAAGTKRLRIWSAGCSTGEEPYTIAMLLRELLPSTAGWDVQVVATDVSAKALDAARAGTYGARSVQLATPEERSRFFTELPDGRYEVRPEVRELVTFTHHNLVTDPLPFAADERLDLVLCRNVTIYFSRETTRALVSRLHTGLRDGGYLFLGHSETLWQISDEFRLVALGSGDSAAYVYRRLDGGPQERRTVLPDRRTRDEGSGPTDERRAGPRRAWARSPAAGPRGRRRRPRSPRPRGAVRPGAAERRPGRHDRGVVTTTPPRSRRSRSPPTRCTRPPTGCAGEALVALGRDDDALVTLRKAIYLDPDDGVAHFQLAGALARTGSTRPPCASTAPPRTWPSVVPPAPRPPSSRGATAPSSCGCAGASASRAASRSPRSTQEVRHDGDDGPGGRDRRPVRRPGDLPDRGAAVRDPAGRRARGGAAAGAGRPAGMRPPLAGVVDLRGAALPVLDLRGSGSTGTGDVLVLSGAGSTPAATSRRRAGGGRRRPGERRGGRRRPAGRGGRRRRRAARLRGAGAARGGRRRVPGRPGCDGRGRPGCRSALDVPLEDAALGQPRQPLAHAAGSGLADALDGLQVVDARGQQLLQPAEVLDQPVDHQPGSLGTLASSR